jgi:hypothetical protein
VHGGGRGGVAFQARAHGEHVQRRAAAGPAQQCRAQIARGADVRAVAAARREQARMLERPHGLAHGVASDAQCGDELRLGRDLGPDGPLTTRDQGLQLRHDLVAEPARAYRCQSHRKSLTTHV